MTYLIRAGRAVFSQAAIAFLLLLSITSAIAAPARPNLLYANPTNANVTLSWDAVPGAASYNVYMANASGVTPTSSGLPGFMAQTGITGTSFTHPSALVNGTTYYFILTSVDATGESTASPETPSTPSTAVDAAKAGVAAAFAQYSSVVNTQGMNLSYTHVLGLYATGFLMNGWDATVDAKRVASDLRGSTLGGWVLRGVNFYDEVNQLISLAGTIMVNGVPQELNGRGEDGFPVLKSSDNGVTWKTYGNQRLAKTSFQVGMRTDRGPNSNTGPRQSVNFDTEAPIDTVASISVSGPGIASSLALNPSTIRIETIVGDPAQPAGEIFSSNAFGTNFAPSVVVQSGSAYTFNVTRSMSAGSGTFVYTVPFVGTAVTDSVNGAIDLTSPAGHTLADATLGAPLPLTWTLPTAYTISEVQLGGHVSTSTMQGVGFSCQIDQPTLPATATSATITFPATCNSQPVVAATVNVASVGTKGERSIILYDFSGGVSVPSAPVIGIATAGNAQATVSFTPPGNNGGSAITGYTVTASPGGATATGMASPITVTGLANGTSYRFTVRATNGVGNSPASLQSNSVTPAGVPGAPTIGASTPGNGQALIAFTVPVSNGGSPITGYTATCNPGALTGSVAGSPVNVINLVNDIPYTCSVTASNAIGASGPSATVGVTPSASAALVLTGVVSRKTHGAAAFDVVIDTTVLTITGAVTVEPRTIGSGHTIFFQFNNTISAAGNLAAVDGANSTVNASATPSGNNVMVTIPTLADNKRITLTLSSVNGTVNPAPVSMGFLVGDVNNTRSVNSSDISGVKARSGQTTTAANFRFDVNATGAINSSDISTVKARSGLTLP